MGAVMSKGKTLLELLVKRWENWPEGYDHITQDDDRSLSGLCFSVINWELECIETIDCLAADYNNAVVTKEMWEALKNQRSAFSSIKEWPSSYDIKYGLTNTHSDILWDFSDEGDISFLTIVNGKIARYYKEDWEREILID
jgi:hypothetical protein